MKRCLSSARPLRSHHGPSRITSPPSIGHFCGTHASRPPSSRWASSASRRRGIYQRFATDSTAFTYEFISAQGMRKMRQPKISEKAHDPNERWLALLEEHLPPPLRRDYNGEETEESPDHSSANSSSMAQESFAEAVDMTNTLYRARKHRHLDLLTYLGFRLNNWAAVDFILGRLLDASEAASDFSRRSRPSTGVHWALDPNSTLDELSTRAVDSAPPAAPATNRGASNDPKLIPLRHSTARPFAAELNERFLAQIWQSLGALVLDAADASPNEAKLAMSVVLCTLARLHTSGAISDRVYDWTPPLRFQSSFRPPGMSLLKSSIMQALTDAAWMEYEADMADKAAAAGQESPFISVSPVIRELGPSIWMELILWCCVEQGFTEEGVWLIERMKRQSSDNRWTAKNWNKIHMLDKSARVWKTNIEMESTWRRPHDPGVLDTRIMENYTKNRVDLTPFVGMGERTISEEVVCALFHSLPNLAYLGTGFRGMSPSRMVSCVFTLKFIFASQRMTRLLATTRTFNTFLMRVLSSGGINAQKDPFCLIDLLKAASTVVPPWVPPYTQDTDKKQLKRYRQWDSYNQTLAPVGLLEYTLRYSSSLRRSGEALRTFAWLQEIEDESRQQRTGKSSDSEAIGAGDSLDSSLSPMPHLSSVTLAELLDLLTASRAYESAEWLFSATDVERPAISKDVYGNQNIAPSILRFAAATKNEVLAESVIGSLQQPLSTNTLRALLNYRIVQGHWDSAVLLLEYLRDHRLKSWGHSNVATLAAEIIRLEHALQELGEDWERLGTDYERRHANLVSSLGTAKAILGRLFAGEFSERRSSVLSNSAVPVQSRDFQPRVLASFHRVFLNFVDSPALRNIAASSTHHLKFKVASRTLIPYIPSTAFHQILEAVVDTQGSAAGMNLYFKTCLDIPSPETVRTREGGIPRMYLHSERILERADPHFDPVYFWGKQEKCVIPNLNTIRVILRAAMKEYNAKNRVQEDRSHNDDHGTAESFFDEDSQIKDYFEGNYLEKRIKARAAATNRSVDDALDPLHRDQDQPTTQPPDLEPRSITLRSEPESEFESEEEPEEESEPMKARVLADLIEAPREGPQKLLSRDNPVWPVLNFCIKRYFRFGLNYKEVNRETGGYLTLQRRDYWGDTEAAVELSVRTLPDKTVLVGPESMVRRSYPIRKKFVN
ncbi:uncharacterized protein BO95DRAFT_440812 [Aspergillus brunneoviolaceus CBS 621.78]|uniref:Uncharacterized protein n=1 Tax=Aspergillus brunneoviolaceus CBS 621.78 TaxID=1450534 RepID=A0ACD1GFS6_9EURO|nr:hypothetical protein BO95DRAFT_440812 [Aspergillus brunneoviolaceus CBS 621.78]RAH48113.1 hypothetical protein BO95DRAFT_440812 [Aspergillus brunneoviolaceus CBS 621.78]